ncbi:MAG: glycerophosphodiester phosphodiesterase [Cyanobacteria bacterium REEB459]|nr:glycerophosphodiester phosphodiesterase [Cyanobacteria bacterium REEB459]
MDWITTQPIAHRGLHWGQEIPENSLLAFEAAIAANHPIELDLQLLADGQLAVFHDNTLNRLTGQPGRIAQQTLASLRQYRLYHTDQTIPCLGEVLALVNGRVPLLLEIKNQGRVGPLEAALLRTLKTYRGEFAVQSFNPLALQWFHHHAPEIWRGQLSSDFSQSSRPWHLSMIHSNLLVNWISQPHFIAYDLQALSKRCTTVLRDIFHIPLITWTVRSQDDQARAQHYADNYIFEPF